MQLVIGFRGEFDMGFHRPYRLRRMGPPAETATHPVVTAVLVLVCVGLGLAVAVVGFVLFASVRI